MIDDATSKIIGYTCAVMVVIIRNGHSDPSSNPGQGCLDFI